MRSTVLLFTDIKETLDMLTDEQAGQIFKAIIDYQTGNEVALDGLLNVIFAQIKRQIDYNNEKYDNDRKKRSEAGKKGMQNRWHKDNTDNNVITKDNNLTDAITNDNGVINVKENDNKHNITVTDTDTVTVTDVTNVTNNNKIRSPAEPNITAEVVDYLNQKLGTRYKADTEKTRRLIRARIREGATLEDFRKVIDKKVKEWRGTKLEPYLRPETLFGTKFEGYLNQGAAGTRTGNGSFTDFEQRNYDFDALEKALEG